MANLHDLPTWNDDGKLVCVVESPRGSIAKFKYDPALEVFTLNRALILGVRYPYNWGFVPSTMAEDGDPLDVMIFHDVPTFPGVAMACEPIGALLVTSSSSSSPPARSPTKSCRSSTGWGRRRRADSSRMRRRRGRSRKTSLTTP